MKRITPEAMAQKWRDNLQGATAAITQGVNAVTEAPGPKAAARKDAYVAGVQREQDKWAERVAAVSLADWKAATLKKGIDRIGPGATQALPKFRTFMQEWINYQRNTVAPQLAQMPKGGLEAGIARSTFVIRANAQFRAFRRGGTFVGGGGF